MTCPLVISVCNYIKSTISSYMYYDGKYNTVSLVIVKSIYQLLYLLIQRKDMNPCSYANNYKENYDGLSQHHLL